MFVQLQLIVGLFGGVVHQVELIRHHLIHIHFHAGRNGIFFTRQHQQRLQQRLHVFHRAPHPHQRLALEGGTVLNLLQQLEAALEHRHRRAQFMTGIAREYPLTLNESI